MTICNSSTGKGAYLKGGTVGVLAITSPVSNHVSSNTVVPVSSLAVEDIHFCREPQFHHRVQQNTFRLNWEFILCFCVFHFMYHFNSSTAYYFFLTSLNGFNVENWSVILLALGNVEFVSFDVSHFAWWAVVNSIIYSRCPLSVPHRTGFQFWIYTFQFPVFHEKLKMYTEKRKQGVL